MPLTPEQRDRVRQWLGARGATARCPACGAGPPEVYEDLVLMPSVDVGPGGRLLLHLGSGCVAVAAACPGCADIRLFSPRRMGILPGPGGAPPARPASPPG